MSNRCAMCAIALVALASASAWAGDEGGKPGMGPGGPAKAVSWDELRDRCLNPYSYDVQRQPQNIKVVCTDEYFSWIASAPGEVPLPSKRTVTSQVQADKIYVAAEKDEVATSIKAGSCTRFREIRYLLTVERAPTCAEILGFKGTLAEYCVWATDATKGANPKLVEQHETGKEVNNCGESAVFPKYPK